MKLRTVFLALTMLAPVPLAFGADEAQPGAARSAGVLQVSALMREHEKHQGPVRVEGVVSRVYPKDQKLGLIDTEEFKRCGVVTCAEMVLPVRWAGAMPEPKAHVRLEGEIRREGERMEFFAAAVEEVLAK